MTTMTMCEMSIEVSPRDFSVEAVEGRMKPLLLAMRSSMHPWPLLWRPQAGP